MWPLFILFFCTGIRRAIVAFTNYDSSSAAARKQRGGSAPSSVSSASAGTSSALSSVPDKTNIAAMAGAAAAAVVAAIEAADAARRALDEAVLVGFVADPAGDGRFGEETTEETIDVSLCSRQSPSAAVAAASSAAGLI